MDKKQNNRSNHNSDTDEKETSIGKPKSKMRPNENLFEIQLPAPSKILSSFKKPRGLKSWVRDEMQGAFYLSTTSDDIQSQSYLLNLDNDSEVLFEIEPQTDKFDTG
jgi:hypothetical protein